MTADTSTILATVEVVVAPLCTGSFYLMASAGRSIGQFAAVQPNGYVRFQTDQSLASFFQLDENGYLATIDNNPRLFDLYGSTSSAKQASDIGFFGSGTISYPAFGFSYVTCLETNDNKLACVSGDQNTLLYCPGIKTNSDIRLGTVGFSNDYVGRGLCELLTLNVLCIW